MYSWEIERELIKNGFRLNSRDYIKLATDNASSQISEVKYDAAEDKFSISTNDGYSWKFSVYPS